MSVRRADEDDLDAIMGLERASFRADAWSESMMRQELTSPHTFYVVLVESGIRGYAGLRSLRNAADADIQTIALAETARGNGQGRMLLRTLLAEAADRGVREVFLDVRVDNAVAQRLYASEGFVEVGRRPNYYAAEGVDALVMKLDMRGWVASRARDSDEGTGFGSVGPDGPKSSAAFESGAPAGVEDAASDAGAGT